MLENNALESDAPIICKDEAAGVMLEAARRLVSGQSQGNQRAD